MNQGVLIVVLLCCAVERGLLQPADDRLACDAHMEALGKQMEKGISSIEMKDHIRSYYASMDYVACLHNVTYVYSRCQVTKNDTEGLTIDFAKVTALMPGTLSFTYNSTLKIEKNIQVSIPIRTSLAYDSITLRKTEDMYLVLECSPAIDATLKIDTENRDTNFMVRIMKRMIRTTYEKKLTAAVCNTNYQPTANATTSFCHPPPEI